MKRKINIVWKKKKNDIPEVNSLVMFTLSGAIFDIACQI